MAKMVYETLKIAFQNVRNFKIQGDVGFNFQITNKVATVDTVKECIKYGVPAVALYVAGKLLKHSYSWINPSDVKSEDELRVSVASGQEEKLRELVKSRDLSRSIEQGFDDFEKNLKEILGKQVFDEVGQEVMDLIGGVRVTSVEIKEPDIPKNMKALNVVVNATLDQEIHNKHDFLAAGKNEKGPIVGNYAGAGANVKQVIHGGGTTLTIGLEGEDLKTVTNAHKELAGDCIRVKIKVPQPDGHVKYFDRKFQPTQTIDGVIMALKKEEKEFYHIFRGEDKLDGDLTLAQAAQDGSVVNWEAKK